MHASWPQMDNEELWVDDNAVSDFTKFQAIVKAIRQARAEYQVESTRKVSAHVKIECDRLRDTIQSEAASLSLMSRVDKHTLSFSQTAFEGEAVHLIVDDGIEVYLPSASLLDSEKEKSRLEKQARKLEGDIAGLLKRLDSTGFLAKASSDLVSQTREQLKSKQEHLSAIRGSIEKL